MYIHHKNTDRTCTDHYQSTNVSIAMVSNAKAVSNKCNTSDRDERFFTKKKLDITAITMITIIIKP